MEIYGNLWKFMEIYRHINIFINFHIIINVHEYPLSISVNLTKCSMDRDVRLYGCLC